MERSAKCPVPTSYIRRVLKRIIRIAPTYQFRFIMPSDEDLSPKPDAAAASEDGPSQREIAERINTATAQRIENAINLGLSKPWWFQMPQRYFYCCPC